MPIYYDCCFIPYQTHYTLHSNSKNTPKLISLTLKLNQLFFWKKRIAENRTGVFRSVTASPLTVRPPASLGKKQVREMKELDIKASKGIRPSRLSQLKLFHYFLTFFNY